MNVTLFVRLLCYWMSTSLSQIAVSLNAMWCACCINVTEYQAVCVKLLDHWMWWIVYVTLLCLIVVSLNVILHVSDCCVTEGHVVCQIAVSLNVMLYVSDSCDMECRVRLLCHWMSHIVLDSRATVCHVMPCVSDCCVTEYHVAYVSLLCHCMSCHVCQIAVMPLANADDILPSSDLPSLSMVYMLDAVIAKIQVTLDDLFTKSMVSALQ